LSLDDRVAVLTCANHMTDGRLSVQPAIRGARNTTSLQQVHLRRAQISATQHLGGKTVTKVNI